MGGIEEEPSGPLNGYLEYSRPRSLNFSGVRGCELGAEVPCRARESPVGLWWPVCARVGFGDVGGAVGTATFLEPSWLTISMLNSDMSFGQALGDTDLEEE